MGGSGPGGGVARVRLSQPGRSGGADEDDGKRNSGERSNHHVAILCISTEPVNPVCTRWSPAHLTRFRAVPSLSSSSLCNRPAGRSRRGSHPSFGMISVFSILLLSVGLLGVLIGRQRVRGLLVEIG